MEDTVQKAIEAITQYSTKFPQKEFDIIRANKEEATPYLRSAIDRAIAEKKEIGEDASLHFYALYLLAEFQDKESFPRIMELASLPDDTLDFLIGDAVTEGLCDILYYTYNGDLKLLKQTICNVHVDDFAKSAMLGVMKQLYLECSANRSGRILYAKLYMEMKKSEIIFIQVWLRRFVNAILWKCFRR